MYLEYDVFCKRYYPLGNKLGNGVYGEVRNTNVPNVVVKIQNQMSIPNRSFEQWFDIVCREIDILSTVKSPCICDIIHWTFHRSKTVNPGDWIVMYTMYEGTRCIVRREDRQAFVSDMASALVALHECGFAHCDVSPNNIIYGITCHYQLIDFSLSKKSFLSSKGPVVKGTGYSEYYRDPMYLWDAYSSIKADIWALGLTIYSHITGKEYDILKIPNRHPMAPVLDPTGIDWIDAFIVDCTVPLWSKRMTMRQIMETHGLEIRPYTYISPEVPRAVRYVNTTIQEEIIEYCKQNQLKVRTCFLALQILHRLHGFNVPMIGKICARIAKCYYDDPEEFHPKPVKICDRDQCNMVHVFVKLNGVINTVNPWDYASNYDHLCGLLQDNMTKFLYPDILRRPEFVVEKFDKDLFLQEIRPNTKVSNTIPMGMDEIHPSHLVVDTARIWETLTLCLDRSLSKGGFEHYREFCRYCGIIENYPALTKLLTSLKDPIDRKNIIIRYLSQVGIKGISDCLDINGTL